MNTRKRNILSVVMMALLIISSINVYSQRDGFFNDWENVDLRENENLFAPPMPGHGFDNDQTSLPLGSGLLVLCVLGFGYAAVKKRKSICKGAAIALVMLSLPAMSQTLEYDHWEVEKVGCNNPMIGCAVVKIDGVEQHNAQYELGAFVGDVCRGRAMCNTVGEGHYEAFIQIYGKVDDVFTFRVYDHNNKWEIFSYCETELEFDNTTPIFAPPGNPKFIEIKTINYIFHDGPVNDIKSYTLSNSKPVVKPPLRNCKVIFDGKATYSGDGSTELKDIVVNANESVTIGAGTGLKANQTVTNDAGVDGIVVQAQAPQGTKGNYWDEKFSSVGSLVSLSENVRGTMETYFDNSAALPKIPDWHLISSPVTGQVIHSGLADSEFNPGKEDDFYLWDETTATWCNIKKDHFSESNSFHEVNGSFNFVPGRGYLASYGTAGVKSYKGVFNNGDVTVNLTKTDVVDDKDNTYAGFNLVGNPYPSFLDWEDTTGWNRSKVYGYDTKEANSQCVMWIYNEDAGNYATYIQGTKVSTNNGTRYIAPGQGFFVKATQAGNLVMRDGARTNEHTESGFMKDPNPNPDPNVLKVRVENEKFGADEVALAISENEMKVDKLFSLSESAPAMYFNDGNGKYSIIICEDVMACGQCDGDADVMTCGQYGRDAGLALNFKAKQMGKYTIKLNAETQGFDYVELEDSFTGEKTNLLVDEYSFMATANDNENRFKLNLNPNSDPDSDPNPDFVFQNGNDLIVKGKGNLQVVDVMGRTIFEKELTAEENVISCDYINKGINIFKLEDKTEKIIIR